MASASSSTSVLREGARLVMRSWKMRPLMHLFASIGAIVYALASVAFSRALGSVTDNVVLPALDGGDVTRRTFWFSLAVLCGVGTMRAFGAMARRWFQSAAEYGTQRMWRDQLMNQFVELPLSYHRRVPAGRLLAHADSDLERSTRMLKPLAFAVGTIALGVASLVALAAIHVLLAAVAVILFPTLSWLNRIYTSRVAIPALRERTENGELSGITHESFDGALVIKTLGREQAEVDRLSVAAHRLRGTRVEIGRMRAWFDPLLEALPNIGIVALVGVGAWLVQNDQATIGELITAVSLFAILSVPVRVVGFFLEEMPGSVAALAQVDTVLDEPLTVRSSDEQRTLGAGPQPVEFRNVEFHYVEGEPVLRDVSFAIPAGGSVAIVGATGSGKSTIVQLVAGLAEPISGKVLVGGVDVTELDPAVRAERIAPVFQEAFLFADTIHENVQLGRHAAEGSVPRALAAAQAATFVGELPAGIDEVVGERGVTLSGGQRQRIALARSLVQGPSVVLLDDATSALDPAVERRVLDEVRNTMHATLILVAYRLATIALADHVVYVVDGRIAAAGSHQELMRRDDYASLVRAYEEQSA